MIPAKREVIGLVITSFANFLSKSPLPFPPSTSGSPLHQAIILIPFHGEPNLRVKDGLRVYSGTPMEDLSDALAKHHEERIKSIRK